MLSPHMGLGRERDRTYYEMLVNRLEFNNNQYVQGVLNREDIVCNANDLDVISGPVSSKSYTFVLLLVQLLVDCLIDLFKTQ